MKKILLTVAYILFSIYLFAQTQSNFIVIDQFGYRINAQKIAVIRDPQIGFDANLSFTPSNNYAVVDVNTLNKIFTGTPTQWNGGLTDSSSGDKAWWFNFSSVTTPGTYYILDVTNNAKSYTFEIKDDIYNSVLKQAMRSFFYQRAGFAKKIPFADSAWVDNASHIGPLQDKNCRLFSDKANVSTEKDLHGGWYDAGDYNKYTSWTGNYIIELLKAYRENPTAWTDDFNIPESGNGIPDIIDEVKWGMDFMLRLQNKDGSLISIVSLSSASPPSSATGQSLYGNVNTSATLKGAATYAYGATVFRQLGLTCYADSLQAAAIKAWNWANQNPNIVWENNSATYNSLGVGAGNMEIDDYGRKMYKLEAASYLFELTADNQYKTYFDNNYTDSHLIQWYYVYPFEHANQEALLHYTTLANATTNVVNTIKSRYEIGINKTNGFIAFDTQKDPYLAHIEAYTWGSSGTKCNQGLQFFESNKYNILPTRNADALVAAENFIHYMHGVNPIQKVYLSNMAKFGAENSVSSFYHSWFTDGSSKWDEVGKSTYGPAPGIIVGGANPSYKIDNCCPNNCGGTENNALCSSVDLSKILNQPAQKSYMDFNTSWPINSWEITENSGGTQVAYIRLLSKFVKNNGKIVSLNKPCITTGIDNSKNYTKISIYPNPSTDSFTIITESIFNAIIYSINGKLISKFQGKGITNFGSELQTGEYIIKIEINNEFFSEKIVKK